MKINIVADDDIDLSDIETLVGFILKDENFKKDKLREPRIYVSKFFKIYGKATKYAKSITIVIKREGRV